MILYIVSNLIYVHKKPILQIKQIIVIVVIKSVRLGRISKEHRYRHHGANITASCPKHSILVAGSKLFEPKFSYSLLAYILNLIFLIGLVIL